MSRFPRIDSPCPYKSQAASFMDGDMCRLCQRQVFDLSAMGEDDRIAFLRGCGEEICVSYRLPVRPAIAAAALAAAAFALPGGGAGGARAGRRRGPPGLRSVRRGHGDWRDQGSGRIRPWSRTPPIPLCRTCPSSMRTRRPPRPSPAPDPKGDIAMAFFPRIQSPCPYKGNLASVMDGDMCRMCKRQVIDIGAWSDDERVAFLAGCETEALRLPTPCRCARRAGRRRAGRGNAARRRRRPGARGRDRGFWGWR